MQKNVNAFEVEEILINILSKLPVRSLFVYMFVCKSWRGLIGSRYFLNLKLIRSLQNPTTYVYYPYSLRGNRRYLLRRTDGEPPRTFPGADGLHFKETVCSFNGLICCSAFSEPVSVAGGTLGICVCNPATGEVLLLPPPPPSFDSEYRRRVGVCFGPGIDGYKVFQFHFRRDQPCECTVYSSATAYWKSIGSVTHAPSSSYHHVCVNGMVYWFSRSMIDGRDVRHVLAVDGEEKFSVIRIPRENNPRSFLINLAGCLSLVVINYLSFDVWALQDMGEAVWVKILSDDTPYDFNMESLRYVSVRKNELFFATFTFYVMYDMETKSWKKFKWDTENGSAKFVSFPVAYQESFLPCKFC